ncbi:hypothetical protein CYY_004952 [Polysphondylium violaceum]|uniref:Beta-Casp domain-containing protein n=1 Tax=Polysphondylium violaceum TaxID=133409 RepID=A0A8J4PUE6_9MYCE|nr:hypothetical protein CYY_004952 [Polysphondylium violaceum]
MKLSALGQSPQSPCYLLEYKNTKIILDCGMDLSFLSQFLPPKENNNDSDNNNNENDENNNSNNNNVKKDQQQKCIKNINNSYFIDTGNGSMKYSTPMFEMVIDFSTIDAILISNYTNIFSLPFITEHTNFKGKIYATEPTTQIGKLLLEELVLFDRQYVSKQQKANNSNNNSNNNNNQDQFHWQSNEILDKLYKLSDNNSEYILKTAYRWRDLYSKLDIEKSFEKIQTVRFNESIHFYSFSVSACSSGFCLGSCNWVIEKMSSTTTTATIPLTAQQQQQLLQQQQQQTGNNNNPLPPIPTSKTFTTNKCLEKIVYLSDSSLSMSRYPLPFEFQPIENPDLLIVAKLNNYPQNAPDDVLSEFCSSIGSTLNSGGNVIIPSYSCGIVLDLFEHLSEYLSKIGLTYVTMYFISTVAKAVLSYADIYSEWLNKSRQERSFMPETPFFHQDMMRKGQFLSFPNCSSNFQPSEPCIIFAGHPSCRQGDIIPLLSIYGDNPKNSVLLIEPEYDLKKTVLPFNKLCCRIQFFPIDPRVNFTEANILISKLCPKNIIVPHPYINHIHNNHTNGNEGLVTCIYPMDILKIPSFQKYEAGFLDQSLANIIQIKSINNQNNSNNNNIQVGEINGILSLRDHEMLISSPSVFDSSKLNHYKERYIWGSLDIKKILYSISNIGFTEVKFHLEGHNNYVIKIINENMLTTIQLTINNVNIETKSEQMRKIISNIIMENCLGGLTIQ